MRTHPLQVLALVSVLAACGMDEPLSPLPEPEIAALREYEVEYRITCAQCRAEYMRDRTAVAEEIRGPALRPSKARQGERLSLSMRRSDLREMSGAIYVNRVLISRTRIPEGKPGDIRLEYDLPGNLPWE